MTDGRKKPRAGVRTVARRTELLAQAANPVEPPKDLIFANSLERKYYIELMGYRSRDDWRDGDLTRLKRVTETWWELQKEKEEMLYEESIVVDDKGKPMINPRLTLIDRLQNRHDAILRNLGDSKPHMDPRTVAKRRADADAAAKAQPTSRLLARPRGAPPPLTLIKSSGR